MANFKKAIAKILVSEGGFVNDKDDAGGMTYKGIAVKSNPNWLGWAIIRKHSKSADFPKCLEAIPELQELVASQYKQQYWDKVGGDLLKSDRVAIQLFDTAVNMGVTAAITLAAHTVGSSETSISSTLINKLNQLV